MGLTVNRQRAKKLTVNRQKRNIFTVNRQMSEPKLAVKFLRYPIDHFHKWRQIINSFASIKISLTNLILKLIVQKNFYSETKLVRLI